MLMVGFRAPCRPKCRTAERPVLALMLGFVISLGLGFRV